MKLEIEINSKDFSTARQSARRNSTEELTRMLNEGIQDAKDGDRVAARQSLLRVTEAEPENEAAWLWLASISEYPEELLGFLQHILQVNPENERALEWTAATQSMLAEHFIQHGVSAIQEDRREFARQCFHRAASHNPQNETAWLNLHSLAETPEEETAYLHQVLEINPANETALSALEATRQKNLNALLKQANLAAISGERETALQLLAEVMYSAPELEEGWMLKAYLAEDSQEKIANYEKVLQMNPDNEAAQAGLGALKALIQKTEEKKSLAESLRAAFEAHNLSDLQPAESDLQPVEVEAKTDNSEDSMETVLAAEESNFDEGLNFNEESNFNEELNFNKELSAEAVGDDAASDQVIMPPAAEEFSFEALSFNEDATEELPEIFFSPAETTTESYGSAEQSFSVNNSFPETATETAPEIQPESKDQLVIFNSSDDLPPEIDESFFTIEEELPAYANFSDAIAEEQNLPEPLNFYVKPELHFQQNNEDFVAYGNAAEPVELAQLPAEEDFLSFPIDTLSFSEMKDSEIDSFYLPVEETNSFNLQPEENHTPAAEEFFTNAEDFPVFDHQSEMLPEVTESYQVTQSSEFVESFYPGSNAQAESAESAEVAAYEPDNSAFVANDYSAASEEIPREFTAPAEEVSALFQKPSAKPFACPFCYMKNEPQTIICSSCRTMLSLSDLEMMLAYQAANPEILQTVISKLETARSSYQIDFENLTLLAIAHLNAKNLRNGLECLQEAAQLAPNDLGLFSKINFLKIRLTELEQQAQKTVKPEIRTSTIMIVDDNPMILKLVSGKLEKCGHTVIPALDGEEALTKIHDVIPDLILLDITMPKMDGYQVCKMIRSNEETKDVPVLMISSKDGVFDQSRGRTAGSTGFIAKPFGPETLMRTIETYLS